MFKWLQELIDMRLDYLERKFTIQDIPCESCEVLKLELAKAHDTNRTFIQEMIKKAEPEKPIDTSEMKPVQFSRNHLPFAMKRQMIEAEDRRAAAALRHMHEDARTVVKEDTLTTDLETEMNIVAAEREAESGR